nr:hypothetical protein Itr_chr03CG18150 [Ipomoea trifida]
MEWKILCIYALCSCRNAKEVWRLAGLHVASMTHDNVALLLNYWLIGLYIGGLVAILFAIWESRNMGGASFDAGISAEHNVVSFGAYSFRDGGTWCNSSLVADSVFDDDQNIHKNCFDYSVLSHYPETWLMSSMDTLQNIGKYQGMRKTYWI